MNRLWPDRRTMEIVMLPTRAPAARLVRPILWGRGAARRLLGVIAGRRRRANPAAA